MPEVCDDLDGTLKYMCNVTINVWHDTYFLNQATYKIIVFRVMGLKI